MVLPSYHPEIEKLKREAAVSTAAFLIETEVSDRDGGCYSSFIDLSNDLGNE